MSSRVTTRSRSSSSKTSARARPRSLAQYIAASASRSTSSGGLSLIIVIPMLAVTTTSFPAIDERRLHDLEHAVRQRVRVELRADLLADHHELVAAEACDEVARAQRDTQARAHLDEERVTGIVAHAVVEHLEAVDVEEEHGRVRSSSARVCGDPPEAVEHELAVREAGERIVARLVREQVLGPVAGDRDRREVRRGREERALRRRGWSVVGPEHDDGTEPPAAFGVVDRSGPPGAKAASQEPLAGDRVGLVDLHLGDDHVVRVHAVEPHRGKAVDRATHLGVDARRRCDVEQTVLVVDER